MIEVFPHRLNEANLQAEIYRRLSDLGYKCELEVTVADKIGPRGNKRVPPGKKCVIDIAVILENMYVLFIEVKNNGNSGYWASLDNDKTRQVERYLQYDIPLFKIGSFKYLNGDINEIVRKIEEIKLLM